MKIVEVNRYSDFLTLEKTWQDILQRCNGNTAFSTWEWLTTKRARAEEYKNRLLTLSRWNHKVVLIRKGFLMASKNSLYNHYWSCGNKLKYLLKIP